MKKNNFPTTILVNLNKANININIQNESVLAMPLTNSANTKNMFPQSLQKLIYFGSSAAIVCIKKIFFSIFIDNFNLFNIISFQLFYFKMEIFRVNKKKIQNFDGFWSPEANPQVFQ